MTGTENKERIVFLGAGNVATNLAIALYEKGYEIQQIYSRKKVNAGKLAEKTAASCTCHIQEIIPDADVYIFSLKDSVLPEVIKKLPALNGLLVHTAGSVSMDIFSSVAKEYGVFYPLQTFSKNRRIPFSDIPLFLEASTKNGEAILTRLAESLSDKIYYLDSGKRKYLHLAAVFSCNFVNYMYDIGAEILREEDLPFDILLPLIGETASKVRDLSPYDAQTGPAVRYDENVIRKHLHLLEDGNYKEMYRLLSKGIYTRHSKS